MYYVTQFKLFDFNLLDCSAKFMIDLCLTSNYLGIKKGKKA